MPNPDDLPLSQQQQEKESHYMARALRLADNGRFSAMPNPRVGCVIVAGDEIIAEGWHEKAGEAHAEIIALQKAGKRAAGSTVYVTLEPCCVQGRTGPCTEALIEAGVARVVYAMEDPNPQVSGGGRDRLQAAGIDVRRGVLAAEALELNKGFCRRMETGKPWVLAKTASSLDGRTAMASGESQWITGDEARQQVQRLRAESCAILTGVGTVIADNPALSVRPEQAGFAIDRQPAVIVVDSQLRAPVSAQLFNAESLAKRRVIVAYCDAAREKLDALASMGVECWQLPESSTVSTNNQVDLTMLVERAGEQGFNQLMVEAGPLLLTSLLQAGLIDEMVAFVAPKLLGDTAKPLLSTSLEALSDAYQFRLQGVETCGNDVMLRLRAGR